MGRLAIVDYGGLWLVDELSPPKETERSTTEIAARAGKCEVRICFTRQDFQKRQPPSATVMKSATFAPTSDPREWMRDTSAHIGFFPKPHAR
jgi:hypothetical protein